MEVLILLVPRTRKGHNRTWMSLYLCPCGNSVELIDTRVRNGYVKSCGCLQRKASAINAAKLFTTHGLSKTSTYRTWGDMRARCEIVSASSYSYYGGRGISVCERWKTYENFLEDMGEKPTGLSLDRVNNNGNYEPGNCRWATKSEQMKNRRPRSEWKKNT